MANKKAKKTKKTVKKSKIDPTRPLKKLYPRLGDGTPAASGEVRRGSPSGLGGSTGKNLART